MSEKSVRDYDKFMLRFPDGMRDSIAERAKSNGRSMNSEIISILEDALHGRDTTDTENELFEVIQTQTELLKKYSEAVRRNTQLMKEITEAIKDGKTPSDWFSKKPT